METIAVESKISSGATEDAFNVKGRRHEAEAFEIKQALVGPGSSPGPGPPLHFSRQGPNPSHVCTGPRPARPTTPHFHWPDPSLLLANPNFYWPDSSPLSVTAGPNP